MSDLGNKFDEMMKREPAENRQMLWQWLSKPWVILLITLFILAGVAALSINSIMRALLHTRPEVVVPSIEGKSLVQALNIVSNLELSLKQEGTEFEDGLPAGTIIRQTPPAGMKIRAERAIRVVISKGGQSMYVPSLTGRAITEAQSVLSAEGLQMGAVSEIFSVDFENGVVISQDPSSGTIVTRGALVDVEISKGLPPAGAPLLPDFIGQSIDDAREWANGVGAKLNIKEDSKAAGPAGTVIKQSPQPGQPLISGKDVAVTIVAMLGSEKGARLTYKVPSEERTAQVRMVSRDNRGEIELYDGKHRGGEMIEVPLTVTSTTRIRIYVNEILKDERVVEP